MIAKSWVLCTALAVVILMAPTFAEDYPIEWLPDYIGICNAVQAKLEAKNLQACKAKGAVYEYSPAVACFLPNNVTPTLDLCRCQDKDPINCSEDCSKYITESQNTCTSQGKIPMKAKDINCTPSIAGDTCICDAVKCFATQADFDQWYAKGDSGRSSVSALLFLIPMIACFF